MGALTDLFNGSGLLMLLLGVFIGGIPIFGGKTIFQFFMDMLVPPTPEAKRVAAARDAAAEQAEVVAKAAIAREKLNAVMGTLPPDAPPDVVYRAAGLSGGVLDWIKNLIPSITGMSPILLIGGAFLLMVLLGGGCPGGCSVTGCSPAPQQSSLADAP